MPKKRRRGCRGKGKRIGRKAKTSKVPSKPDVDESIPSSSEDRQNQPKSHAVYMRNWRNSQTGKESTIVRLTGNTEIAIKVMNLLSVHTTST